MFILSALLVYDIKDRWWTIYKNNETDSHIWYIDKVAKTKAPLTNITRVIYRSGDLVLATLSTYFTHFSENTYKKQLNLDTLAP